jgi:peptidoglycan/xylan/chitin deacetylase (PgdA/CDA1 family)
VLCYHSIALDEEHLWRRPQFFTHEEFEARLRLLTEWRLNVLPLDEGIDRLRAGTLPPRSAVLTFDDGSADFGLLVWPLLKRFGYPATVYATTYYSEKRRPIFPLMCSYVLWKARTRLLPALPELGLTDVMDLQIPEERDRAQRAIVERADLDQLTADEKDERLARVADRLGVDYADLFRRRVLQLMTPEEMARLTQDGADIQLHTHRHRTPRDHALFVREIDDNRLRLERATGRHPVHFCYPSGVHFPEYGGWLATLGVRTATTCSPADLATPRVSPLFIPRVVDTAGLKPIELEGWYSGLNAILPRRFA